MASWAHMAKCITEKNVFFQNKFVNKRIENYKLEDLFQDNELIYMIRLIDNYFPLKKEEKDIK